MRREDKSNDPVLHFRCEVHATRQLLRGDDCSRIDRLRRHDRVGFRRSLQHFTQCFTIRRRNFDLEEEAIELRLGKRKRSLLLDRVLRRHDEERSAEIARFATHRHAALLHRFEKRRLRLWARAIDFVGQDELREERTRAELNLAAARRLVFHQDRRTRDIRGHHVGRELNAAETKARRRCE